MVRVKVYVEGGGAGKDLRIRCQEAFHQLLEKARPGARQPRIVAHGGREQTFDAFKIRHDAGGDEMAVLLVDSETHLEKSPWAHLLEQDGWSRPEGASDDQCQLMVTCMETWILADRATLKSEFQGLVERALLPIEGLEGQSRSAVQSNLKSATRHLPPDRRYAKGRRSFQILAKIDPQPLIRLKYFARLIDMLNRTLESRRS